MTSASTCSVSMLSNANRNSENVSIWSHITSNLLFNWIKEENSQRKLLIIDSRSIIEYNTLHIANAINIPYSRIIQRKLFNDKISISELLMKHSASTDFIDDLINIVIYDKNTEHTNQLVESEDVETKLKNSLDYCDSFSVMLLNKLAQKFKSVSFLTGGFVNFQEKYPYLCVTNSLSTPTDISPLTTTPNTSAYKNNFFLTLNNQQSAANSTNHNDLSRSNSNSSESSNNVATLMTNKPRPHVFKHSISSYDTTNEFFRTSISPKSLGLNNEKQLSLSSPIATPNSLENASPVLCNTINTKSEPVIRKPTKILSYLYLGSQEDALSEATMTALQITNVLNVSINCPKPNFISDAHFLRIPINDGHDSKIRPFFDVAFKFIEKCRKANGKVIIHCLAGISRSPTLAIAYLMKHLNLKSDDAYNFVKEKRSTISPNFNFLGQLYEYEKIQLQQQQHANQLKEITELTQEKKEENENNNIETEVTSNIVKPKTNAITFFKISNKKMQSSPSLPLNDLIQVPTVTLNTDEDQPKVSLAQRKKQFIFQFNSNNQNENMLLTPSSTSNKATNLIKTPTTITASATFENISNHAYNDSQQQKSLLVIQSSSIYSLPSPSQAFSKFNLNSPTANKDHIFNNNHQSSSGLSELIMQRPTNFLINHNNNNNNNLNNSQIEENNNKISVNSTESTCEPLKKVLNNLKRPSSILFETNNTFKLNELNENVKNNEINDSNKNNITVSPTTISHNNSSNQDFQFNLNKSEPLKRLNFIKPATISNFSPSNSSSMTVTNPLSLSSSSSTSSSFCPCCNSTTSSNNNSRSSSSLSLNSSSNISISSTNPLICASCSLVASHQLHSTLQQQQTYQQYQKKMKLSPVRDRSILNNFSIKF